MIWIYIYIQLIYTVVAFSCFDKMLHFTDWSYDPGVDSGSSNVLIQCRALAKRLSAQPICPKKGSFSLLQQLVVALSSLELRLYYHNCILTVAIGSLRLKRLETVKVSNAAGIIKPRKRNGLSIPILNQVQFLPKNFKKNPKHHPKFHSTTPWGR